MKKVRQQFDNRSIRQLVEQARFASSLIRNPAPQRARYPIGAGGGGGAVAIASSTISARSGTTAGQGTAIIQTLDLTTGKYTAGQSMTVYSPFSIPIPSGTWITLVVTGSAWHVFTADCASS